MRDRNPQLLSALALLCLPVPAVLAQPLAIPNPSFENLDAKTATPAGWTAWAQPNWAVYSLAAARTGAACVAITDDSDTQSQGLRSPRIPVTPGKTYRASVWISIERLTQGGFALYLEYWQGETRIADRAVSTDKLGDWTQLTLEYPAPPDATAATLLVYGSSATVGRAYFDDAALESP